MEESEYDHTGGGIMGRKVSDETLFKMIKDFLMIYLPVQRKSSPNTVNDYRIVLDQFITYISKEKGIQYSDVKAEMINRKSVEGYLDDLQKQKEIKPSTRNNRLAAIKSFLKYAAALRPEYVSIISDVAAIKTQKDDPFSKVDYMTEDAVKALLNEPDTTTAIGMRDQFFMILLYDTGGRIQEIINIRINDLKIGKISSVLLHGKGQKDRIVPLMDRTVDHLKKYMSFFHPDKSYASADYLFYSEKRNGHTRICDDTIRVRMNIYAASARKKCPEVPDRVHPHLWRHTRAMHLYQHGMDLTLISQWLGHKNYTTTLVYAYADTEAKRKAIEKAMADGSPTDEVESSFTVEDEDLIKKLYGLK